MPNHQMLRVDGIKWWIESEPTKRLPVPICPDHDLRLTAVPPRIRSTRPSTGYRDGSPESAKQLRCAEGPHLIDLPRTYADEKKYVIDRIDAKVFKGMRVLNLDDEALPVVKTKLPLPDSKYFVTAQLMESKRGLQLVIYAGERGKTEKTQMFVEPATRRFSFDQRDLHPADVFLKVQLTFDDGTTYTMEK